MQNSSQSEGGRRRDDVRMRGFASRSTVQEAISWIDRHAATGAAVAEPLGAACGRVLAADVVAGIDVPAFERSAMDGYALHADETTGAGIYNPLTFRVVGQSLPGRGCAQAVGVGEAVRIMTGAPLPAGADAVLPAEFVSEAEGRIDVTEAVSVGKHVGRIGEDVSAGTLVLRKGRRLRAQDVGVLASLGAANVHLVRRPRVRIIVTGDELVIPGEVRTAHQIYEANSFLLRGLVHRDGGILDAVDRLPDDREQIRSSLTGGSADVILVSGGSSVGAEDHAPALLADEGELAIHGIAMRPSSPTGIGKIGATLVFLLPGNPVSCLCAYDFFAGRGIRKLGGRSTDWPYRKSSETAVRKIASAVGRVDYCRVRREEGGIAPVAISGASILSSTTRADGFAVIPAESEGVAAGAHIDVYWYDE